MEDGLEPVAEDHAEALRDVLVAERERRGWSLTQTAKAIARELGGGTLSKQSFQAWEKLETQPKIDQWNAWARALGHRLEVCIVPRESPAPDPALALHAHQLAGLDQADRDVVMGLIERLRRR